MKKLFLFSILLLLSTTATPMQRSINLAKKYSTPLIEITTGLAFLGISAYLIYTANNQKSNENLPTLEISGADVSSEAGQYCGNFPCWRLQTQTGNIAKMVVNNTTYTNIPGHTFTVSNHEIIADGKTIAGDCPCGKITASDLFPPYTMAAILAYHGLNWCAAGIKDFKKTYSQP